MDADFLARLKRSAALVDGLPAWSSAGIVLSDNFEGGRCVVGGENCRLGEVVYLSKVGHIREALDGQGYIACRYPDSAYWEHLRFAIIEGAKQWIHEVRDGR